MNAQVHWGVVLVQAVHVRVAAEAGHKHWRRVLREREVRARARVPRAVLCGARNLAHRTDSRWLEAMRSTGESSWTPPVPKLITDWRVKVDRASDRLYYYSEYVRCSPPYA